MCNEYPYETVNIIQIGVLGHGKCFCSSVDVLIEFHANNITGSGPVLSMLIYQQECGVYVFFSAITDVNNKNMKYKMIYYAYEILKVAYPCLLIIFKNTPCFCIIACAQQLLRVLIKRWPLCNANSVKYHCIFMISAEISPAHIYSTLCLCPPLDSAFHILSPRPLKMWNSGYHQKA